MRDLANFKVVLALCVLSTIGMPVFSDSLNDNIISNNLQEVRQTVEGLSPDLGKMAYLSTYLKETKEVNIEMVSYLIDNGASVSLKDEFGLPPLFWAILRDEPKVVESIVGKSRGEVNSVWNVSESIRKMDYDSKQAFETFDSIGLYLDAKGNLKNGGLEAVSPLALSIRSNTPTMTKILIENGAQSTTSIQYEDKDRSTAKKKVYSPTNVVQEVVLFANELGSDGELINKVSPQVLVNCKKIIELDPKFSASVLSKIPEKYKGNAVVSLLLADLSSFRKSLPDYKGESKLLLPFAASISDWKSVDVLLKLNGMDVNDSIYTKARDEMNVGLDVSLLDYLLSQGYTEPARYLLDHGATLKTEIAFIQPNFWIVKKELPLLFPIHLAVLRDDPETVKLLVEHGIDLNKVTVGREKTTVNLLQYTTKNPAMRELLVGAHIDITKPIPEYFGGDALFACAYDGDLEGVIYFLKLGLPVDGDRANGASTLFAAIRSGNIELVRALTSAGADIGFTTNVSFGISGMSPYDENYPKLLGKVMRDPVQYSDFLRSIAPSPSQKNAYGKISKFLLQEQERNASTEKRQFDVQRILAGK